MNKKIKVTSLTAVALASLTLANANVNHEVKADVKPDNATAKAQTPEEAAKANVASAQKKVDVETSNVNKAKGDLDQAKKDAVKPDADYQAQSDKVDGLKKTADQKKSALDDAKSKVKNAQDLANEAKNPAKVQAAKDAVTKQESTVTDAKKAKDDADKAVSDKQAEVNKANDDVKADTQDVQAKANAKDKAQQELTDATNALNGTGLKEANQKVDDAKKAKRDAESQLTKKNQELSDLNDQKSQIESNIQTQQKSLADDGQLKKTAADARQYYNKAVQKLAQLNQQIQSKQTEIQNLQDQLKTFGNLNNTIIIGDLAKYKQAYKDNINGSEGKWTGDLSPAEKDYLKHARAQNRYQHSEEDKNVKVDPSNLTDAQITDLSRFAADIINKVRNEMGLGGKVEVTTGAEAFAKNLAQGYEAGFKSDEWHLNDGHYAKKINEIAQQMGLKYDQNDPDKKQYYEDKSIITWESQDPDNVKITDMPKNMDEVKERIYDTMLGMILPDGNGIADSSNEKRIEFGHANGLLGLPNTFTDSKQDNEEWKANLERDIKSREKEISGLKDEIEKDKRQGFTKYLESLKENLNETEKLVKQWNTQLADVNQSLGVREDPTTYQVAAVTSKFAKPGELAFQMHFITVRPQYIEDAQKFNSKPLPTADKLKSEIGGVKSDKQNLESQKASIDEPGLKAKLDTANDAVKTAQQKLAQLQQEQESIGQQIQNDQNKIHDLQAALAPNGQITKNLASANAELSRLTASHEDKQRAYDKANKKFGKAVQELENAQDQLKAKKRDLEKAKQALANLKEDASAKAGDVENANTELAKAEQHVQDLNNAAAILSNAQQEETAAQGAYDTAKRNLDEATAVLNGDLKTNKDHADAKVVAAQHAYDDAVARLQAAKDALARAQQALQDLLDAEYVPSTVASGSVETKKSDDKQEPVKTPEVSKETNSSTTYKKIRLTHNAFIYDKHGKVVKSGLRIKWIKRGKLLKVLKHAKIVKINGKRYYQIGRNKFVKVANFKLTTHAVHFKARIKGNKKIRMYSRNGKLNKHYARPYHTYTFNEKAKINGKTYYKIAGTNDWIPAKKLALKK